MQKFFNRLDRIAQVNRENKIAGWLERIAFIFLALMVLFAPHSIAATQTAWILGMLAWLIRLFLKPRPQLFKTRLNLALLIFFGWSAVTAVFSYAPALSFNQLRGVALFLIFYFVANVVRTSRAAVLLAFALIASCMVNVLLTPVERLIGRGVEIHGVRPESPLAKALLYEGDTLLKADRKKIGSPEELIAEIERNETTRVEFYRPDFYFAVDVKRENLLGGANALEKLGVESWKKSRNWRSTGFYGHWTTYAEVLQLIASLAFGLLIASLSGNKLFNPKTRTGRNDFEPEQRDKKIFSVLRSLFSVPLLLLFCLGGMLFALLLTATRASQAGFLVSAFAIVLLGGKRKMLWTLAAIVLPLAVGGLIFLQQSRNVGFIDEKDDSTRWRQTVYREGLDLWTDNPRNFLLGVGMDSVKRFAGQWRLFDDGKLPMGHFHSTPLQLVVERGLPALLIWLWILWLYGRMLARGISDFKLQSAESENPESAGWREKGILLGCFGGLAGFFTSGLVHYNLGDQEVAMIFFLLMGLSVKVLENGKRKTEN